MKITFVLPGYSKHPIGGFKMVFEYANRLSARGHEVFIAFDCSEVFKVRKNYPEIIRKIVFNFFVWYYPKWFPLDSKIHKVCILKSINNETIPDADVVFATAATTVYAVAELNKRKGRKFYFIQGFENWGTWTEEEVKKTYKLGLTNIVVAKWLKDIVENCILIPNCIDLDIFNIDIPIEKRNSHCISMLYHNQPEKGSTYGIEALKWLKERYPDLQAVLFGVPERPQELPSWIQYVQCATQKKLRQIYNDSAIYLCPSIKEGFGLTGAEAMACGCAYVASDYGGVHEYAENGRNVLLSEPKDVKGLVDNVIYLFEHEKERITLAQNGYHDIQKLDWNNAVDAFERAIACND